MNSQKNWWERPEEIIANTEFDSELRAELVKEVQTNELDVIAGNSKYYGKAIVLFRNCCMEMKSGTAYFAPDMAVIYLGTEHQSSVSVFAVDFTRRFLNYPEQEHNVLFVGFDVSAGNVDTMGYVLRPYIRVDEVVNQEFHSFTASFVNCRKRVKVTSH